MSADIESQPAAPRPRRRQEPRFAHEAPLRIKCTTWSSFHELFTLNISRTGLFVPTDAPAKSGEEVKLVMHTPDGTIVHMEGVIRHVLTQTARHPAGIGIELTAIVDRDRELYHALVSQAERTCAIRAEHSRASGSHSGSLFGEAPSRTAANPLAKREGDVAAASPRLGESPSTTTPPSGSPPATPKATPPPAPANSRRLTAAPPRTAAPPLAAIDFGTSRSSISLLSGNQVQVLKTPDGGWDIASVVGFFADGSVCVGNAALDLLASAPDSAIRSPKRLLGRMYHDTEISAYLADLTLSHSSSPHGEILLHPLDQTYSVAQICAPVIYRLKQVAEASLETSLTEAVFTTPVSFDELQFSALREAAELAGLRVAEFVDEPTAAALCHRGQPDFRGLVAVYDFGGGTFDFSVLDVSAGDVKVVATAGDSWLGGDDFDDALAGAAANDFWQQHKVELRKQVVAWHRLRLAAERAKRQLSATDQATVSLQEAALRTTGPLDLEFRVTSQQFGEICHPIILRSFDTCNQALGLAGIGISDLNAVYLSGGTTYIPAVRAALTQAFGKPPRVVVPPERAVATGAAIYADMLRSAAIRAG